ncbi:hypothetical protein AK812_SmicGene32067 [Symbiodinium microadriaticum]|uniref:Uncharacterized protein n=1 Tax=Symbiodinium microadriaticum TaxID=2951 RepID=A0A1Q9CV44_SYMMI|nr:hypothetical protein AK812_SmicGene32067 [Symbiodinium microadriaticum]
MDGVSIMTLFVLAVVLFALVVVWVVLLLVVAAAVSGGGGGRSSDVEDAADDDEHVVQDFLHPPTRVMTFLDGRDMECATYLCARALTGNSWHKMCPEEIRLAKRWYHMMA